MIGAPLQPTLKAASTAQHTQLSAVASSTPTTSRAASPARPRKVQKPEVPNNDYLSEKATLSLVRRVLITEQHGNDRATPGPIEGVLPPLTSSNDVDIQLYAIISIVVKDFIQPWYSKITPDHSFVEEVVHIIAHCSRALEQRLRHIDVAELTLNEIPALFEQHTQGKRRLRPLVTHELILKTFERLLSPTISSRTEQTLYMPTMHSIPTQRWTQTFRRRSVSQQNERIASCSFKAHW